VIDKELANNTLVVAQGHDHPGLLSYQLSAIDASWVSGVSPANGPTEAGMGGFSAKTRYRQADAACEFIPTDGPVGVAESGQQGFELQFKEPQWAVTPGQSAVLYQGPVCLGGGIISARSR